MDAARLLLWVLPEIGVGVAIGLGVALILEVFVTGAQILSLNAGFVLKDPLTYRTDDIFGVGMGYARVSSAVAGLAQDTGFYNAGAFSPQPSGETFVEVTYQYWVFPWFQLQPDVQYVFNPGGGIANPNASGQLIQDELVLGMRGILQL